LTDANYSEIDIMAWDEQSVIENKMNFIIIGWLRKKNKQSGLDKIPHPNYS
jgi:hypothetical protein